MIKDIKLLSLFSGIGAFEQALKNINIDFEIIGFSEIDNFAIETYKILHGENYNFGDIEAIDAKKLPCFNFMSWGFPCQDFSICGTQKGFKGEKSILYNYGFNILKENKPNISIIENVSALLNNNFREEFNKIMSDLKSLGYYSRVLELNAFNFGIPQNRKRVFIISSFSNSILKLNIKKKELKIFANELLESEVHSKYYLSEKMIACLSKTNVKSNFQGKFNPSFYNDFKIANTITTRNGTRCTDNFIKDSNGIRRLTPLEVWRLMGWSDKDFYKVRHLSDTQLYKMAGNSIVIQLLEEIIKELVLNKVIRTR